MAKNEKSEESDLDRMALEEIIKEAKRGKERAETMGPMGWIKCPLVPTNKRFFRNVLMGTLTNQKQHKEMKEKRHERRNLTKDHESLTSDPPSGSSEEERMEGRPNEHSLQPHTSLKYPNKTGLSMQERSENKYKQSTKDYVPDKRFYHRHSSEHDKDRKNAHKKSKVSRKGDVAEKSSCPNHERHDEKPYLERNGKRKHRLEEHKKKHKSHKHRKKRKKCRT